MRMLITAGVTLALLGVAVPASAAHDNDLRRDAAAIHAAGATGVQAHINDRGRRQSATSGFADLATGRPVPSHGYFRIGSTNKTLVATVVLQLVGEGRMRLDDPVERWLPGLVKGNGYDGRRITVRQLLHHTAGIYDGNFPGMESEQEYHAERFERRDPPAVVAAALSHPPDFQPGKGWSYSNSGYVLVGMVVEAATGRPWHKEVAQRILRPLGMRHTIWPGDSPFLPRPHAKGYTYWESGKAVDTTLLVDADASGGYVSTAADVDRFVRALFTGELLAPAQLAEMQRTVAVDPFYGTIWPGARYGLGVVSRSLPCGGVVWMPSGDQYGFQVRSGYANGRSVVTAISTLRKDSLEAAVAVEHASVRLVNNALC
jgi:D-alanyl-D-alanine carboxypeptidase